MTLTATILSQRDYIFVMCLLREFQADGTLGQDDFNALMVLVVGEDLVGHKWMYDADLAKWARTDVQPWQEGDPRGPLLVAFPVEFWDEIKPVLDQIAEEEVVARGAQRPAVCPTCGSPVELGGHFCPQCGADTPLAQEPTPAAQSAPKFCPNCGNELVLGQKFCTGCGQDLQPFL
jgi:predicted RNA-binding Zn-ribbon protein involved in translation (DUF1610 family)